MLPLCERAAEIEAFLEPHGIGYRGQSLASAAHGVFVSIIRASRDRLAPAQRRALVAKQRGNCALCASPLQGSEAAHICEVANQTKSSVSQWQMLCPQCHRERSDSTLQRPENPILSHFSPMAYDAFVKAPRPAQAVFCPNAGTGGPGLCIYIYIYFCR